MGVDRALAVARTALGAAVLGGIGMPHAAAAQDGLIVQPAIPQGFDRDRNVSVSARPRPDYNPLGISVGGLLFFPRVETGAGATSNTYLTNQNQTQAAFVSLEPSLRVASIWSRHSLEVNATTLLRNYIGQSPRNERTWNVGARGKVDMRRAFSIVAEANASQSIENQFSGEVGTTVAALSRFRRDFVSLRGDYTMGRGRAFVVADFSDLRFSPVRLTTGTVRDQDNRNRNVSRVTGQVEFARTPSISLFAQLGYTDTNFDGRQLSTSGLDSGAGRVLAGANIDLAGQARGTIGIGYSLRDYRSPGFTTVKGLVAEGRVELFPTELFTITAGVRRSVEDATFGNTTPQPFWDNRITLRGDFELLSNLILSGNGEYARQNYITLDQRNSTYRLGADARYLVSRRLTLDGSVSYTKRQANGTQLGNEPAEARVEAGLTFHI
jgi:hypothetical protein